MLQCNLKFKKDLKAKVGSSAYGGIFTETSMFGEEIKPNATVTCTNHPKRSWFASVQLGPDCEILAVD